MIVMLQHIIVWPTEELITLMCYITPESTIPATSLQA